jgi:hypothetical protein
MAAGSIIAGGIFAAASGFGGGLDATRQAVNIAQAPSLGGAAAGGPLTNTQPVNEAPQVLTGSLAPSFFGDYYNRIHYSALSFALGNISPGTQRTLTLWNAFLTGKAITAVTPGGSGGIDATGPGVLPYTIAPLAEAAYTFTVRDDGPAVIATAFTFSIGGVAGIVALTGSLVTPWLYRPAGGVLERLEWLTDVLPSFNGGEQRRQLREAPRRVFEFDVVLQGRDRRLAENGIYEWGGRGWALPVWMDAQPLPAPVAAGATTIAVDTTTRDFRAGCSVVLMRGPRDYEILQVDTVAPGSIVALAPTARAWPAGEVLIAPLRTAMMPDEVALSRFDGDTSYGRMRFEVMDPSDWPAAAESTYRGLPVLAQPPNWTEDVQQGYERLLQRIDSLTGPVVIDDQADGPILLQSHRWLLDGRVAIAAFRSWLYARRGRLSAFWLPTWAQDFRLVASVGASALTIDVEHCDYTESIGQAINRRDVRIELHSGATFYRRIGGSTVVSADVERLTIDAALGVLVQPAEVRAISYIAPVRMDTDAVEIAWARHDLAESRAMTRGSRNDI